MASRGAKHYLTTPVRIVAAGLLLFPLVGMAAKAYSVKDLIGEYKFRMVEIGWVDVGGSSEMDHCTVFGTATFDGAGTMTATGTRRCSVTGPGTSYDVMTYDVTADGEVFLYLVPGIDPRHGQLVDKGRMLLIDDTARTDTTVIQQHGIAVKP